MPATSNDSRTPAPDSFLQGFGGKKLFTEGKVKRGTCVEIEGLKAKPELNGLVGVVLSYDKKTDRYGVDVDCNSDMNKLVLELQVKQERGSSPSRAGTPTAPSTFSLKKANLAPIWDPASWRRTVENTIKSIDAKTNKEAQRNKQLRFDLNDRVVCDMGARWIAGQIVGADPKETEGWCYLVRTDPHPGIEGGGTLAVPSDTEDVCVQEVCFSLDMLHHTKGAAPELPKESVNKSLRFKLGQRVTCRVCHQADLLENWQAGVVESMHPTLPGPLEWGEGAMAGVFPASVPYRVQLDRGDLVLCHADNHSLIRREGLEPQVRVKGISHRMEDRIDPGGLRVRFDHVTERKKRLNNFESPGEIGGDELTEEQKKAMFIC